MSTNYLLLIEDRPGQVDYIRDSLKDIVGLNIVVAATLGDYNALILQREWDAVIADLQVPRLAGQVADIESGRELLADLWPRVAKKRIMVLTVHLDQDAVQEYLHQMQLTDRAYQKMPTATRLAKLVKAMLDALGRPDSRFQ